MKKTIYILIFTALSFPLIAKAQANENISSEAKIDSIYKMQKKIYAERSIGPLANKTFGIEVNLFRLLLVDKATTFSGTFSLFNTKNQTEIAFPVYFQAPVKSDDLKEFTIDCHYRIFFGQVLNGSYISAFTRIAHLSGTIGTNDLFENNTQPVIHDTQTKLGIGFGIGYRKFSKKGIYWGTSLNLGRYLTGNNDRFKGDFLSLDDDNPIIIDVEFFKFGWAF